MERIIDTPEFLTALTDAGIGTEAAEEIVDNAHSGKWERVTQLILSQRAKLVSEVHVKQENLYRIDFLLQKIKDSGSKAKKGAKP